MKVLSTTDKTENGEQLIKNAKIMFGPTYWVIVIILTLMGAWSPWKNKVQDGRYSKGHREVNDGTPFFSRLKYAFVVAMIITTVIYGIFLL